MISQVLHFVKTTAAFRAMSSGENPSSVPGGFRTIASTVAAQAVILQRFLRDLIELSNRRNMGMFNDGGNGAAAKKL